MTGLTYYYETKIVCAIAGNCLEVERYFSTPYVIYEVHKEERCVENEFEFRELESTYRRRFEAIYRCFFKPEIKSDFDPKIKQTVTKVKFNPGFYNSLEQLIRAEMYYGGWAREEVINGIKRVLALPPEEVSLFERENLEQLRAWVEQAPEVIAA